MRAIETEPPNFARASLQQDKKRKRRKLLLLVLLLLLFLGLTFTSVVRFFWPSSDQTASTDPRTPAQVNVIETGQDAETKNAITALQSMVASLQQSVQELESQQDSTPSPTLPTPSTDLPPQSISYDAYQNLQQNNHLNTAAAASILTRGTITNEFLLKSSTLIQISDVNGDGLSDGDVLKWDDDTDQWVVAEDEDDNSTYQAGSGLSLNDDVFSLGGTLDANTTLDLGGFVFTLANGDVAVADSLSATTLYQNGNQVCDMSGNCGGGGVMTLTLAGDSGVSQTINNNDTITISGGNGLSSVGSATDTITLNVGAGAGISVATDDVAVDQAFAFAWTGAQSWASSADFNGDVSIADTDILFDGLNTNFTTAGNFSINNTSFFVQYSDGNIGVGTAAPSTALDVLGGISTSDDLYIAGVGLNDSTSNTTSGASLIGVFDEFTNSSSSTVQAVLADLDAAITGASHAPVTLAGAYDYITLSGQQLTLNQLDLDTDVTGVLPLTNGGTNADLSGVSNGGIIYKSGTALAGSGSLTGVLKGNGSSAPTAMTGTTNYVTRWTDANTLGTGILYDNATNVGVGTTSPGARLDVVGGNIRSDGDLLAGDLYLGYDNTSATISTFDTDEALTLDPDGTGVIFLHGTTYYIDSAGLIYASGLATTGYTPTSGELRANIFRDGNSAYYLQPADTGISAVFAGNVGIGTTTPNFALQVNGVIAPETTDQDLGTSSLRWDVFANSINADSTITFSGLSGGTTDTVLILNGSNQVETRAIDPRAWGTTLVDGSGTASYITYWSDNNTLTAEQYLSTVRGGLGADVTAAGAGELLYSTSTTTYDSLPAGTVGYVLVSNGAAAPTWIDSGALGGSYWAKIAGVLSPALAEPLAATSSATTVATFTADGSNDALQVGGTSAYARFDNAGNLIFTNGGGSSIDATATLSIGGTTQTGLTLGRSGISTNIANLTTNGVVFTSGGNGTLNSEAQLAITRGGTNSTASPTAGAVAYGTGTAYAFSSAGTIGQALLSGGTGSPSWGTLGLSYGGTNADLSAAAVGGLIYKGVTSLEASAALTGVLKGNGSSAPTAMTGTTNYVTRWTDANTLGTGILYDDGTNVGIGTATPDFALQVNGVIAPETTDQDLGTSSLRWDIFANSINADSTITLSGLNVGVDSTVLILNGSNQVETREIDPQVWSSDLITGLGTTGYVTYWTGTDTIGAEQYLSTIRGGLGADVTAAGAGELLYSTSTTTYDSLAAGTLGYVLASGGTGSPSWVDPASLGTNYWQYLNGAFSPRSPFTNNTDLLIGGDATDSAKFAVLNIFPGSGTPTASVSSGLAGSSMYMTADGTLATHNRSTLTIGNSSSYDTTGNILIQPNATGNVSIGTTASTNIFRVKDSQPFVVDDYAVGIGTATPNSTSALHIINGVDGPTGVRINSTSWFAGIEFGDDGPTSADFTIGMDDDFFSMTVGNYLTSGDAGLGIHSSGNVGIGTIDPSAFKLQIAGSIGPTTNDTYDLGSNTLRWQDLYLGGETIHLGASTTDEGLITYNTSSNIFGFNTDATTNGDIAFFTDDLYLDKSSGNIGISTTTPSSFRVQVAGSIGPNTNDTYDLGSNTLRWQDLYLGGETIHLGASTTDEGLISYSSGVLSFSTDTTTNGDIAFFTDDLYLDKSSGNVGIGTTTPAQSLHVNGDVRISGLTASLPVKTNANKDLISGAIDLASAEVTGLLPLTNGGTSADLSGAATGGIIFKGATALEASGSLTGVLKGNGSSAPTAMTGITNYVTRWSDANTLGTGVLYDDGTNVGVGTTTPTSFMLEVAGSIGPSSNNSYDLGSNSNRWANVYATNFYQNGNAVCDVTGNCAAVGNLWQYSAGAISPATPYTDNADLLIGSNATASAKFAVLNIFPGSGSPTASVSSGLAGSSMYMTADGTLATHNRSTLTIGNSSSYDTTGNVVINPNGTGFLGIGTTEPLSKAHIETNDTGWATRIIQNNTGGGGLFINTAGSDTTRWGLRVDTAAQTGALSVLNTGSIGIGTTNPGANLDLTQASGQVDFHIEGGVTGSDGTFAEMLFLNSADSVAFIRALRDTADNKGALAFGTQTSATVQERMRIANNGNVGIGTTNPSSFKLQVNGNIGPQTTDLDLGSASLRWDLFANTINADSTVTLTGLGTGTDNTVLILNASNNVTTDEIDSRVWGSTLVDGSGTANYVARWSDTDTLTTGVLYDNGTNVGIGTTTPNALLAINTTQTTGEASIRLKNSTSSNIDASNILGASQENRFGGNITFGRENASSWTSNINNADGYIAFAPVLNGAEVERMRVTSNGNVGIGITAPTGKLHVADASNPTIRIDATTGTSSTGNASLDIRNDTGATGVISVGRSGLSGKGNNLNIESDNEIRFYASDRNTLRAIIDTSGNVGINVASPSQKLDVAGNAQINSAFIGVGGHGAGYAHFSHSSMSGAGQYALLQNSSGNTVLNSASGQSINFRINNQDQMTLNANGNFGIGTATPATKLAVEGDGTSTQLRVTSYGIGLESSLFLYTPRNTTTLLANNQTNDILGSIYFGGVDTGTSYGGRIYGIASEIWGNGGDSTDNPTDIRFATAADGSGTLVDHMAITSTGNVGIGTTSPNANLHIYGTSAAIALERTSGSINEWNFGIGQPTGMGLAAHSAYLAAIDAAADFGIRTTTSGASALIVKANGNVGVGTNTPGAKLSISGATAHAIEIDRTGGQESIKASASDGYLIMDSSGQMAALNWYVTDHVILANGGGNVGIDVTSPSQKLDVAGNAQINSAFIGVGGHGAGYAHFSHSSMSGAGQYAVLQNSTGTTFLNAASGQTINFRINNTNQMVLNANGNLGIGASSPTALLHVAAASNPNIRIDASSGTSSTGNATLEIRNDANVVGTINVGRSGLSGKGSNLNIESDNQIRFYASDRNTLRAIINADGNFGIGGITAPSSKLHVHGTVTAIPTIYGYTTGGGVASGVTGESSGGGIGSLGRATTGVYGASSSGYGVYGTSSSGIAIRADSNTSTAVYADSDSSFGVAAISYSGIGIWADSYSSFAGDFTRNDSSTGTTARFRNAGGTTCTVTPGAGNFACTSDARLKKDVSTISNSLDAVLALRGVQFRWNSDNNDSSLKLGFIAQEVEAVVPEIVFMGEDGYRRMDYSVVTPLLVNAMQEQQTQIEALAQATPTNLSFSSAGQLTLSGSSSTYTVTPVGSSSPLATVLGASQAVVGKITSGLVTTRELVVSNSAQIANLSVSSLQVSGQNINDYIKNIVQQELAAQPTALPQDAIAQDFNSGMVIHNYNTTVTIVQNPTASSSATFSATSSGELAITPEINVTEVTQVIPDPRFDVLATLVSWSDTAVNGLRTLFFNTPTVFRYLAWFQGPVKVNADTSGTILIPADTLKARVSFSTPFPETPTVHVTFTDGVSIAHTVTDVNASGFTINFANAPATDLSIQWLALLREDSQNGPSLEIMETADTDEPATVPAPTSTPTPEPSTPPEPPPSIPDNSPTPTPDASDPATPSATGFSELLNEESEATTEPETATSSGSTP